YRSANLPSVLVLHMLWTRAANTVREKIIGIKNFVAQIFINQPVEGVGATLRGDGDQRSGTTAVLRGIRVGGNLEFLNCIHGRPNDLRCKFLHVFGKRVVVNAVEHEVVLQGTHAMYIHGACAPGGGAASLLGVAISLNTGNQAQQVIPVACAKRHAADELISGVPLSARNWDDLLGLVPGVQGDRYTEQGGGTASGRTGAVNVHGVRSLQNNFVLDGVDNNSFSENVQELTT